MSRKVVTLFAVVGILGLGLVIGLSIDRGAAESSYSSSTESNFFLSIPAFAQGVPADQFPNNEAGISAYVNLGHEIDLERARSVFKGIEADEVDYLIGIIELPNLAEDMWPHAYVSKSGWLMAYYSKTEPTSKLMQWSGFQRDVINTTTLKDALVTMCQKMALDPSKVDSDMSYYHFQYPNATKLLIALDTTDGVDTFQFTIPPRLSLYEASWSHHGFGICSGYSSCWTESKVDGTSLVREGSGTYVRCGVLDTQHTTPGAAHTVWIGRGNGWAGCAIVFLYN